MNNVGGILEQIMSTVTIATTMDLLKFMHIDQCYHKDYVCQREMHMYVAREGAYMCEREWHKILQSCMLFAPYITA